MTPKTQPKHQKNKEKPGFLLNSAQQAAATAPIAPLLIVAGAGTGKTRTLTSRIVHLVQNGTPPERICAITFTNKAAKEMASRIAVSGPFIGTFHALGARILRRECRAFGRTPNFTIFDDHDSFDLIKKVSKAAGLDPKKNKKDTPAFFAGCVTKIKNLGDGDTAADGKSLGGEKYETEERKQLIREIYKQYESALERNNAFDFDDLIQKPVELFKKDRVALERYRGLFDAVLVDEYQDINPKQYELVKFLASSHRNLSVVGDDEQTIYSWRFADIRTFLGFDREWPGANIYFLEENYRSTGNIIRAASSVAAENKLRTPKKLWTQNPEGARIALFEAWGENDEAEWATDHIQKIRSSDPEEEIAVLYRTNAQSRAIEQALIRREIPYRIFGGLKFYERREVKDAVAALRWASNHKDEISRERLEKNVSKRSFAAFKEKAMDINGLKPLQILKIFIETFNYFEYLEEHFTNADEREDNITELITFVSEFDDLAELLERLSLLQSTDEARTDLKEAKVSLMTIHMAKGLEFDSVFVIGVAEGFLPHIRSIDNDASIEEERRLMYVAMTRARKKLHLSFSGMPSRFIAEIPQECVVLAKTDNGDHDAEDGDEDGVEARDEMFDDRTDRNPFEENIVRLDE